MIKTEIKYIYKSSNPISLNGAIGGGGEIGTDNGITNSSFLYYTMGWSGDSTSTSDVIYPSIYNDGTLQSINIIDGWNWYNGSMYSQTGSTNRLYQELSDVIDEQYYSLTFNVKNMTSGGITPWLCGNSGTTITQDGQYTQIILVSGITDNFLSFTSDGIADGGLSNITLNATGNLYKSIDLYDDDSFNLTLQIQTDISNKAATYSKTLTVPGTAYNNLLFGNLFEESTFIDSGNVGNTFWSGTTAIFLNKKIQVGIYVDTIELMTGILEITRVLVNDRKYEYECTFYTEMKTFADILGTYNLWGNEDPSKDISFDEYNHSLILDNIVGSWTTSSTSKGYYYPIIDYGNNNKGNNYFVEMFKPAIYVKELWDKIFTKAGFTYTSTFLNSPFFKSLIIPQGNKARETDITREETKFHVGMNYSQVITYYQPHAKITSSPQTKIGFNLTSPNPFYNFNNSYSVPNYSWSVNSVGSYNLSTSLNYWVYLTPTIFSDWKTGDNQDCTVWIDTWIYKKYYTGPEVQVGHSRNEHHISYSCITGEAVIVNNGNILVVVDNETAQDGWQYYVKAAVSSNGMFSSCADYSENVNLHLVIDFYQTGMTIDTFFDLKAATNENYYLYGQYIYVNDCMPDMTQIDFIKSICNKFSLMFVEDRTNYKTFIIEPYSSFYYRQWYDLYDSLKVYYYGDYCTYLGVNYVYINSIPTSETGGRGKPNVTPLYFQVVQTINNLDWSDKVDLSKEKWIDRIPTLIDKNLSLNFADDTNDYNLKLYSDTIKTNFGNDLIVNPYYNNDVVKVDDKFSSTFMGYYGETSIICPKIYGDNDVNAIRPQDFDYTPRVLYRSNLSSPNTTLNICRVRWINNTSGITILNTLHGYYPYAGIWDDPYKPTIELNYGVPDYIYPTTTSNNIGWVYWREKVAQYMNPNSKMVTAYIKLTPTDIATIDFRRRVIINNNLYHINRIIEWLPGGDSCKVELYQEANLNAQSYWTPQSWQVKSLGSGIGGIKAIATNPPSLILPPDTPSIFPPTGITSGFTITDYNNYVSGNNLVIGAGNVINSSGSIIQGSYNQVNSDNVILLNSSNVIIETGLTNIMIIGATGGTITESNTTIITNLVNKIKWITDVDLILSGYTIMTEDSNSTIVYNSNVMSAYFNISSGITFSTGTKIYFIQYASGGIFFIADPGLNLFALNSYFLSSGSGAQCTLEKLSDTDWVLYGDLALP